MAWSLGCQKRWQVLRYVTQIPANTGHPQSVRLLRPRLLTGCQMPRPALPAGRGHDGTCVFPDGAHVLVFTYSVCLRGGPAEPACVGDGGQNGRHHAQAPSHLCKWPVPQMRGLPS